MKHNLSPPRGMRDILPSEAHIRQMVQDRIRACYNSYGYQQIETPFLEHIDLLTSSEGGDNAKLIYHILKRGDKLNLAAPNLQPHDVADLGLRFDLTVPLARYYAHNRAHLPSIVKTVQIAPVFRAERPQRGRFRQFTQCDIDNLGMAAPLAEIELIYVSSLALESIGFSEFTIRINDRRILSSLAKDCGCPESLQQKLYIIIDKLDKIGLDGVQTELDTSDIPANAIKTLMGFLTKATHQEVTLSDIMPYIPSIEPHIIDEINHTINTVSRLSKNNFTVQFDPTLVRGMGYYTGQIFEITYKDYPFSIAGGGRYDNMIGAISGHDCIACGFSLGFERIIYIIQEEGFSITESDKRLAFLIDSKLDNYDTIVPILTSLKSQGFNVSVLPKHKKIGKQLNRLKEEGFSHMSVFDPSNPVADYKAID